VRRHFPDVYRTLLAVGAPELDSALKIPGPAEAGDEELRYILVRRPVIEWALRRAAAEEAAIVLEAGVEIEGLVVEGGRVRGALIDGVRRSFDLVIDALGRRTQTSEWLREAGLAAQPFESRDCAATYYSRYYQVRSGVDLPDGPWFLGPRGDLGYFGYSTFPGDNRTFAAILVVPAGVPEWKVFKDEEPFEAAVASIPGLRQWVIPNGVEPITDVLVMAGFRNSVRSWDPAASPGLVPLGDAFGHTDPTLAYGMSIAFMHSIELQSALRQYDELDDACASYAAACAPILRERFELATALCDRRYRLWMGETVDPSQDRGNFALFSIAGSGAAGLVDTVVARMFLRRFSLLDRTGVFDSSPELQARVQDVFARIQSAGPPRRIGPSREEMLAIAGARSRG
jgi:2-polyprenyl-6-methoxyphenol hydroxylase-like FAD-dependent oxidoreductase